jgi:hypothetical protein
MQSGWFGNMPNLYLSHCPGKHCKKSNRKTWPPGMVVISIPTFALPEMNPKQYYDMTGPDIIL